MPKNLTDTSLFSTPVTVPAGGDPRSAASVEAAFQTLANRTRYLYDSHVALYSSASSQPEGVVTGNPGEAYWSTYELTYWLKSAGAGDTGWLRLVNTDADGAVHIVDHSTGSDRTHGLEIQKIATIATGRSYAELRMNSSAPVGDTRLSLFAADDADHPGEIWLRAANSDNVYAVLAHGTDPALYPVGDLYLGTAANPWKAGYFSGLVLPTGSVLLTAGDVNLVTGNVVATAGYVSAELRPRSTAAGSLPDASTVPGSILRRAAGALPATDIWSDGSVWRDLRPHRPGVMTDANRVVTYAEENFVFIPDAVLTATRAITMPTDAGVGEVYEVSSLDTTNHVTVNGYSVANIALYWRYVRFLHMGAGVWVFAGGTHVEA